MIPVTTAVLVTSGISITVALAAYVTGVHDRRKHRRALRAVWRAEVHEETRPAFNLALQIAEQRGAKRAREACNCATADRQIREARAEITDLRGQLDVLSRRLREDDRTDAPEVTA